MYCLLRGFPAKDVPKVTQKMARELNFIQHLDKKVKEYSGKIWFGLFDKSIFAYKNWFKVEIRESWVQLSLYWEIQLWSIWMNQLL